MFLKQIKQSISRTKVTCCQSICTALLLVATTSSASAQCVAELVASDGAENDRFGYSVAVSGNVALVGAFFDDDGGPGSGTAFIYEFDGEIWNEMGKLTPSDHAPSDQFGSSVAIEGDVAIVGAQASSPFSKGAAYIFVKSQNGWTDMTETAKLTADGGADFAYFGWSAAISGDTIVIGAAQAFSNSGAAYVFDKPVNGWETMVSTAKLTVSDPNNGDHFGQSVAIHGDTIAVGANDVDINGVTSSGAAYVFVKPNDGWIDASETATLTASDGEVGDVLGYSITIAEDVIVVGAPITSFGSGPGLAYIYHMPKGGWANMTETFQFKSPDPIEEDYFGNSMSISGDLLIVSAHFGASAGSDTPGTAYVYDRNLGGADNWGQLSQLSAIVPTAGDEFGQSVSIDGEMILVGADFGNHGGNGSAYAFRSPTGEDCDPEPCPWDSNFDGSVGTSDLLSLFAAWGPNPDSPHDFDEDGAVGTSDLLILFVNWGPCP